MPPHYNLKISMNVLLIKNNKTNVNLFFSIDQTKYDYSFDNTNYVEIYTIKENLLH